MTARRRPAVPTDAELQILNVLWRRGPSTVRDVHETLGATGYTTVLKLLQIMLEKRLVDRDERDRAHVYAARIKKEATQGRLIKGLVDRAFGGSATGLVMRALAHEPATREELEQIRELLDRIEEERR